MFAASRTRMIAAVALRGRLLPFLDWRRRITPTTLRADLGAGLVSALLVLPQAIAFATLAGVPPEWTERREALPDWVEELAG